MRLAVFDLDHTLLDGDSDTLWCDFLMDLGLLDRAAFAPRSAAMERGYRAGTVTVDAFTGFYVGTLAGLGVRDCEPLRQRFWLERVQPSLFPGTAALLQQHRDRGDLMVLSTASNRVIAGLTATGLGFEHLIATECEVDAHGRYTGRLLGRPNMRDGKVARLREWLQDRGLSLDGVDASFYSDSMNDLPLLECVRDPVVTHGDAGLVALARQRGWRSVDLRG